MEWIKISDQLPEVNTEILGWAKEWIDEDFTPDGIRVCFLLDTSADESLVWRSAGYYDYHDKWYTINTDEINPGGDMTGKDRNVPPTHWMPKPLSPK